MTVSIKQRLRCVAGSVVAVAAVLTLAGAAAPAYAGACDAMKHRQAISPPAGGGRPALVIGDSVMLGAADTVAAAGFEVDARGCRQWSAGLDIIRARARGKTLPRLVIVALGSNGGANLSHLQAASEVLGRDRVLGLVTPRGSAGVGATTAIRRYAAAHPGRVVLMDWVRVSGGHGSYFGGDGLHLGPAGARAMAQLMRTGRRQVGPRLCL